MNVTEKGLGRKVKELRNQRGFSQEDLASSAGITRRTVQRIEAGAVRPYNDTLQRLSRALDVEVEELTALDPNGNGQSVSLKKRLVLFHLSPLTGFLIPLAQILAPLILWLAYRTEHEAFNRQVKDIVLFHAATTLLLISGLVLISYSYSVGYYLAAATVLFCTGLTLWNAYRLSEHGSYNYFTRLPGSALPASFDS